METLGGQNPPLAPVPCLNLGLGLDVNRRSCKLGTDREVAFSIFSGAIT